MNFVIMRASNQGCEPFFTPSTRTSKEMRVPSVPAGKKTGMNSFVILSASLHVISNDLRPSGTMFVPAAS